MGVKTLKANAQATAGCAPVNGQLTYKRKPTGDIHHAETTKMEA
jgi:hypothetical protein